MQGPLFFGPACECDRDGCPSSNGELCSARGECTCTGCRCNLEPNTQMPYYGDACECSPDTDCVDPNNSTVSLLAWLYTCTCSIHACLLFFNPQSQFSCKFASLTRSKRWLVPTVANHAVCMGISLHVHNYTVYTSRGRFARQLC